MSATDRVLEILAELERRQEEAKRRLTELDTEAQQLRADIAKRDEHLERILGALGDSTEEGLRIRANRATVRHRMQPEEYREGRAAPGRKIVSRHPFPRALKAADVSVTEWAKKHGVSRSAAKSWFLDGDGGRPIPRALAEGIEREFGVPATAKTWKNGIK